MISTKWRSFGAPPRTPPGGFSPPGPSARGSAPLDPRQGQDPAPLLGAASRSSRFYDLASVGGLMKALPSWKLLSSPADGNASEHVPRNRECIDPRGCFAPAPPFLTDQGAASAMAQLPVLKPPRLCRIVRRWRRPNCRRRASAGVSTGMRLHTSRAALNQNGSTDMGNRAFTKGEIF